MWHFNSGKRSFPAPHCIIATEAVTVRSATCLFPNVKPPLPLGSSRRCSQRQLCGSRWTHAVTLPLAMAVLRNKVNVCQPERHDETMSYICQPGNIKHLNPTLAANGSGTSFFLVQFQHAWRGNAMLVRGELTNPTGPAQSWQLWSRSWVSSCKVRTSS